MSELNSKTPENSLRYFPIRDEPESWEHNDGTLEVPILNLIQKSIPKRVNRHISPRMPIPTLPNHTTPASQPSTPLFFPSSPEAVQAKLNPIVNADIGPMQTQGASGRQSHLDEYWADTTQHGNLHE